MPVLLVWFMTIFRILECRLAGFFSCRARPFAGSRGGVPKGTAHFQFTEQLPWVESLGFSYTSRWMR